MVGPRPALPSEAAQWEPKLRQRLRSRPGLTGMWQVHGRSDAVVQLVRPARPLLRRQLVADRRPQHHRSDGPVPAPSRWRVLRLADEGVDSLRSVDTGSDIYELVAELFPICRSITGDGVRETLRCSAATFRSRSTRCRRARPCSTGPCRPKWNIRDAYIADADGDAGRRLPHEQPARRRLQRPRSRPAHAARRAAGPPAHAPRPAGLDPVPDVLLPRTWGFCLSADNSLLELDDGEYEVCIDTHARGRGSLTLRRVRPSRHDRPTRC